MTGKTTLENFLSFWLKGLQQFHYNKTLKGSRLNLLNEVLKKTDITSRELCLSKVTCLLLPAPILLDRAVKKLVRASPLLT